MGEEGILLEAMNPADDFYEVRADAHPCLICGGTLFEWGIISRFMPLIFRRGFRFFRPDPTLGVKARHCLTCHHIQLLADEELSHEQNRSALIVGGVLLGVGCALVWGVVKIGL